MKKLILLIAALAGFIATQAQEIDHHNELGFSLGAFNYVGDLSPTLTPSYTRPGAQFFYRYNFKNDVSVLRFNALWSQVYANESESTLPLPQSRGLILDEMMSEFALIYEYNFLNFRNIKERITFSPYLFGGIGVSSVWSEEQKSHAVFPFGAGIKYAFAKQVNVNVEYGARKLFTDEWDGYADDELLSSSVPNDWYHFISVGITFTMYSHVCPKGSPRL